jgi:hypothetical protein
MDRWTIDPRPVFPKYSDMIYAYRRGGKSDLHQFVLACISKAAPAGGGAPGLPVSTVP